MLKFQAVAEKTAKDARGLLYFAAPGIVAYLFLDHGRQRGCWTTTLTTDPWLRRRGYSDSDLQVRIHECSKGIHTGITPLNSVKNSFIRIVIRNCKKNQIRRKKKHRNLQKLLSMLRYAPCYVRKVLWSDLDKKRRNPDANEERTKTIDILICFWRLRLRGLRNNICYFSHVNNFWLTLTLCVNRWTPVWHR